MTEPMTMNRVIHAAVRRDLDRLATALHELRDGDRPRAEALDRAYRNLRAELTRHHEGEDTHLWPMLATVGVDRGLLDAMEGEHATMAGCLAGTGAAMTAVALSGSAADAAAARASVVRTREVVEQHFRHEETELEPQLAPHLDSPAWKAVEKKLSRQPLPVVGGFFAWLTDGMGEEQRAFLRTTVPAPVVAVLARGFGRRYYREVAPVWRDPGSAGGAVGETFAAIADERRGLAALLSGLTDDQQATQSLCREWSVREVVAHLVVPLEVGIPKFALAMLACRGNFDRANVRLAREQARRPFGELLEVLRRKADSRFTPPGLGPEAPLTDLLVHGLDIRWPLGLARDVPEERVRTSLTFLTTGPAGDLAPRGRLDGLRFEAADIDWTHGSGPTVRGNAEALLLAITGRTAALDHLSGDGVATLRNRLG